MDINEQDVSDNLQAEQERLYEKHRQSVAELQAREEEKTAAAPPDLSPEEDKPIGRSAAKKREEETVEEPEEPVEEKATSGEESRDRFIEETTAVATDVVDKAKQFNDVVMAVPAGTVDWAQDAMAQFGIKTPKFRKYDSEYAESVREISSFIVPNLLLGGAAKSIGVAANAKVGWAIGQSKLMQLLGTTGVDVGTGVLVDYTNTNTEKGDNLTGFLKKTFPQTFSFVSDDIATVDGDTPDVKRLKSVYEGVGLGMFTSLFEAAGVIAKARLKQRQITKLIPEGEDVAGVFKAIDEQADASDSAETVFARAMQSAEEAVDEVGDYIASKATNQEDLIQPGVVNEATNFESGARSADRGGVLMAGVDAVRVQKNLDSRYGRLGSIITEAAKRFGLEANNLSKRLVVKQITDTIAKGGRYAAELASGKRITFEEIDAAGTRLAEILVDPRMETGMLKATLDEYKDLINDLGKKAGLSAEVLGKTGYNAAMKAIKGYMDEYINMDAQKAAAYLATSMAGEMSDIAEGLRYVEAPEAIGRAQEMILDRMEYLMVEKGLAAYNWGASLNFLNTWKRFSNNPEILLKAGKNAHEKSDDALKAIIARAKNSANSLRAIAKERPQYLVPLQMAWEFSDGNIDTLTKLHNFIHQSTGTISKAFLDRQSQIPSVIMQGVWSNIYNSVLSSPATPIKALAGNAVLMLQKPISIFAGALVSGDMKTVKRGVYQYQAVGETFTRAWKHMGDVFRKASQDPTSVGYIMREELVAKNEQQMDVLHSFAVAAQREGNDGPMALYNVAETMQDIANHPWLRFGANAMTALDGFTRSALANIEARGRVYDKMIAGGEGAMLTADDFMKAEKEIYDGMFDKHGMITDSAVDYASREIALNLDTDNVKSLSGFLARAPMLKPFLMFPRTADNMILMVDKFSPISAFAEDYNKIALPFQKYSSDHMKHILDSRGIKYGNVKEMHQAFQTLKAEIRGRKAIGAATILGASFMFAADRLHGNGHYDKERQRIRKNLGWKPRSYKGWDGKWYSYEFLGPMADFLSVTADIMDNSDTIDDPSTEKLLGKMMFVLGANLTNKSFLAGLEPMNDVLSGNPAAMSRWGANFGSSLLPLSGLRNSMGALLSPALREVDQDLSQLFHNRNKFVDLINPEGALPDAYDWVDGRKVGYPEDFFTRAWNAFMPMKVAEGMSDERNFLIEMEFDARPTFAKAGGGVDYTPSERSELFRIMGERGVFRDELRKIMNDVDVKKWRAAIKEQRGQNFKIDEKLYASLYARVNKALRKAKGDAERLLSNRAEIVERRYQLGQNRIDQQRGQPPSFPLTNR